MVPDCDLHVTADKSRSIPCSTRTPSLVLYSSGEPIKCDMGSQILDSNQKIKLRGNLATRSKPLKVYLQHSHAVHITEDSNSCTVRQRQDNIKQPPYISTLRADCFDEVQPFQYKQNEHTPPPSPLLARLRDKLGQTDHDKNTFINTCLHCKRYSLIITPYTLPYATSCLLAGETSLPSLVRHPTRALYPPRGGVL